MLQKGNNLRPEVAKKKMLKVDSQQFPEVQKYNDPRRSARKIEEVEKSHRWVPHRVPEANTSSTAAVASFAQ
jgi:hypothetical protein